MRSAPLALLALVLGLVTNACSSEPTQPQYSEIAGIYRLQLAQGATLTLRPDPGLAQTATISAGHMVLDPA